MGSVSSEISCRVPFADVLEILELIIRPDSQLGGTICKSAIRVGGRRRISEFALFKGAVLSKILEQKKRFTCRSFGPPRSVKIFFLAQYLLNGGFC